MIPGCLGGLNDFFIYIENYVFIYRSEREVGCAHVCECLLRPEEGVGPLELELKQVLAIKLRSL